MHRIEEFGHLGGFDRQLGKTGKEGGKRCNVPVAPPCAQDIFAPEPQNEEHAGSGCRQVQRGQSGLPHIGAHRAFFILRQRFFIASGSEILTAVYAVGHGVLRAVQRVGAQRSGRFFVGRSRTLHRLFHQRRAEIGDGRKNQTESRQPPVVNEKHDGIAEQSHAGIKNFGGEFPHALRAVIHIGNGLGHQLSDPFFFQRRPAPAHQIPVKHAFHAPVDVIGKPPDIKALDKPGRLHGQRDGQIRKNQQGHGAGGAVLAKDVGKALRQPAFKPRSGQQTYIINQSGQGDKGQRQPFRAEIGADPARIEYFFAFHLFCRLLLSVKVRKARPAFGFRRRVQFIQ